MLRIKDAATAAEWSAFEGFLQLAALRRAHRRDIAGTIVAALRGEQLRQPLAVTAVCAAAVSSPTVIIAALNGEIAAMKRQVTVCFGRHRDAAIYLSQPGTGEILGARLGEFGDDPHRYASARARKNYMAYYSPGLASPAGDTRALHHSHGPGRL